MKKIFLLPILFLIFLSFSSCEDDSKNPLPKQVVGQYMKLDIDKSHWQLDYNDVPNTYFGGTLSNPGGTVVKFNLTVRRSDPDKILTGNYVPLMTITSFPYELKITPAMLAEALGLQVSDLKNGDFYRFYGYSYDASGNEATYRNLSSLNKSTNAMEQGYRFNTELTSNVTAADEESNPYNNRILGDD